MKALSSNARNILIGALYNDASRADLDPKKGENYAGSLKAMLHETGSDWANQTPHQKPPSPDDIAEADAWLTHMRHTHPRLKTDESRARAAVRQCGIPLPDGRGNLPLSSGWLAIKIAMPVRQWRLLLPFAYYANNNWIAPREVADAVMAGFCTQHLTKCDRKSGIQTVRAITNTWNVVAPALGLHNLAMPLPYSDRDHYMPNEKEFAASLLSEIECCEIAWATVPSRGKTLSPKSAKARGYAVRLTAAAYCRATGRRVGEICSLAELLNVPNLTDAFNFMIVRAQKNNPKAVRTDGAYNCSRAVREAAYVILPAAHELHARLNALVRRLSPGAKPRADADDGRPAQRRRQARKRIARLPSAKKQRVLLPVTDPEYATLLRSTPAALYAEHKEQEAPDSKLVTRLVHACALELMMATSLWPYEIAGLRLGRHLQVVPDGDTERYRIRVSAEETNHPVARDCEIIGESARILHHYLTRIRPLRVDPSSDWLFGGRTSSGYHTNALSQAVCRLVTDVTGHRISAKDLRAAVAVMYGLGPAGSDAVIQRFLGRKHTENDPIINLIAAWRHSQRGSSGGSS